MSEVTHIPENEAQQFMDAGTEISRSPERRRPPIKAGMVRRAWDTLPDADRLFVVRSLLFEKQSFDSVTEQQKQKLLAKQHEKERLGADIQPEREGLMNLELMRAMHSIVQSGDPRGKYIFHEALSIAQKLPLTEADKKTLREHTDTSTIEDVKASVKKRVMNEREKLTEFIQERIDALADNSGNNIEGSPDTDIPEGPPEEFLSPESWKKAYRSGLNWTSFEAVDAETGELHTKVMLYIDPHLERFGDNMENVPDDIRAQYHFDDELARIDDDPDLKRLDDKKLKKEELFQKCSWEQSRGALSAFVTTSLKNNTPEGEAIPHNETLLLDKNQWDYPTHEEAGPILEKLKKNYPDKSIGIYTQQSADGPNADHQLAYLSATAEKARNTATRRIVNEKRRPYYQEDNIEIVPIITLGKILKQNQSREEAAQNI